MADHPLRTATHRRLGGPLPHQLANGTRTLPVARAYAEALFTSCSLHKVHAVLAPVSKRYPTLPGRSSTRYSPVRHFTRVRRHFHVRLACVKHAASVQSEPESNSPVEKFDPRDPSIPVHSKFFSQLALHLSKNQRASTRNVNLSLFFPFVKKIFELF